MARRVGPSLDQATVVQAAVSLADEVGWEQVTLSGVAVRLGVQTPSLYHHLAGLAGLRRALTLWGLRELTRRLQRAAAGKAGAAALLALAHTYREFAHEHPGVYPATLRAPEGADAGGADAEWVVAAADVVDVVLAVLAGFGLAGDDALHAMRGLRSLLHGFVALEAAGGFGLPLDLDESFERLLQVFSTGLQQLSRSQPR